MAGFLAYRPTSGISLPHHVSLNFRAKISHSDTVGWHEQATYPTGRGTGKSVPHPRPPSWRKAGACREASMEQASLPKLVFGDRFTKGVLACRTDELHLRNIVRP